MSGGQRKGRRTRRGTKWIGFRTESGEEKRNEANEVSRRRKTVKMESSMKLR